MSQINDTIVTPEYDCCKIVPWLKEVGRDGETVTLVVARNSVLTDKESLIQS